MIKCFLVPMTEPPYTKESPRRPKYVDQLRTNWTGSPLNVAGFYVIKVNSTPEKLAELQVMPGVVDFPNIDEDKLEKLPAARKTKDENIKKLVNLPGKKDETVRDFINRVARSEGNYSWDKDKLLVPE